MIDYSINLSTIITLGIFAYGVWKAHKKQQEKMHKDNLERFAKIEKQLISFDHLHKCMDEVKEKVGKWNEIFTEMGLRDARDRRGRK